MSGAPERAHVARSPAALLALIPLPGALAVALGGGTAASASEGSTPAEMNAYVSNGLVADLTDLHGKDAAGNGNGNGNGNGIAFDESTTTGPLSRVFIWTDDFLLADAQPPAAQTPAAQPPAAQSAPARRLNEWITVISVAGTPVGVATVGIPPAAGSPSLAGFVADAAMGVALAEVPAAATLVRDDLHGAWLAVVDDALSPLVAGTSGVTAGTSLAAYHDRLIAAAASAAATDAEGSGHERTADCSSHQPCLSWRPVCWWPWCSCASVAGLRARRGVCSLGAAKDRRSSSCRRADDRKFA